MHYKKNSYICRIFSAFIQKTYITMKDLRFRHATVNAQDFLFSMKENNEEP